MEHEQLKEFVTYEAFGAKGDGETDDMEAICAAHAYANSHGLPVKTKPDATYYIGSKALTAVIETDVDWGTTRFTIDDTAVENHKLACFHVRSVHQPYEVKIQTLTRDQKQLDLHLEDDCYVIVANANVKRFIRYGLNQDNGSTQTDCFILNKDGFIASPIDWDYEEFTRAEAWPIDQIVLKINGGIFTTLANRGESKYDYYSRGIDITRSNTVIDGMVHYVAGEIGHGSPYRGFLSAMRCAYVTFQNCFVSGHKIYTTIGSAGEPVRMGSYDLHANSVIDFKLLNCRMNNITDRTRWGVIGSNFCKNIWVENCTLSRLDAHMGVSGTYTIKDSHMGWQGVNAIGRGLLTLDNVVAYGRSLVEFRHDYGSTWEGNVVIRDSKWIPSGTGALELFSMGNHGEHDFGYPCYMPQQVEIVNLHVDDSNLPEDYEGLYLFSDPCDQGSYDEKPYPYLACKKMTGQNITTASGKQLQICRNPKPFAQTEVLLS
ncbi:hypothetical protein [Paenibacillus cremeus]|uniref:Pectate lyase superfamily protein domain-containing protein n=1 Tax=Paenibacillus cremeus TaxID=2163881 RepID=A0A559KIR7_9BACL|nr:hypothetical protein [Paenibacillus cremeus]TVY12022.1 hypothetical protein FPZ49_01750 [Paenibacillus cremeus]